MLTLYYEDAGCPLYPLTFMIFFPTFSWLCLIAMRFLTIIAVAVVESDFFITLTISKGIVIRYKFFPVNNLRQIMVKRVGM